MADLGDQRWIPEAVKREECAFESAQSAWLLREIRNKRKRGNIEKEQKNIPHTHT